jgi:hypothetical protein
MTTKVTIDPANHRIEVVTVETTASDSTDQTIILEPNSPPFDLWIHSTKSVRSIREVAAAPAA